MMMTLTMMMHSNSHHYDEDDSSILVHYYCLDQQHCGPRSSWYCGSGCLVDRDTELQDALYRAIRHHEYCDNHADDNDNYNSSTHNNNNNNNNSDMIQDLLRYLQRTDRDRPKSFWNWRYGGAESSLLQLLLLRGNDDDDDDCDDHHLSALVSTISAGNQKSSNHASTWSRTSFPNDNDNPNATRRRSVDWPLVEWVLALYHDHHTHCNHCHSPTHTHTPNIPTAVDGLWQQTDRTGATVWDTTDDVVALLALYHYLYDAVPPHPRWLGPAWPSSCAAGHQQYLHYYYWVTIMCHSKLEIVRNSSLGVSILLVLLLVMIMMLM